MIRRGFWLAAGAVLGVSGYRRASRLARALVPPASGTARGARPGPGTARRRPELTGRRVLAGAARAGRSTAEGVAFVRDVREGMAEYLDHREQDVGAAPGGQRGRSAPGSQHHDAVPRNPGPRYVPRRPAR